MKDPIKEVINKRTGIITYEFAVNLVKPDGWTKSFVTRRRGFKSRKKAWESYMLLKSRAAQGIYPDSVRNKLKESDTINSDVSVATYFNVYWKSYKAKGNESTINDKTFGYFKNHILPNFGETQLKKVTPLLCRNFAEDLAIKIPSSSRQVLVYWKAMLQDAVNMGVLEKNPMENVHIPINKEVRRKKEIAGEEDVFFSNYYNIEELMKFLSYTKQHSPQKVYTFFLLLAHSGLRRGEAFALRWNDIDFEKRIIKVNKSVGYSSEKNLHLKSTKNHESRKVPIDKNTLEKLKEWKDTQLKELVFKKNMLNLIMNNLFLKINSMSCYIHLPPVAGYPQFIHQIN
ncbi:tyrosine-type recombinase/integrase [Lysinibacillus fusiformis]|uniref:tyrosine-type recombinase/integrase n=1 Tax=Lysinibacillus fusiformis TaxID=28031 RepID=UPI001881F78C|nr:site-specific integrase [Lysinibacillus fusiformis]MBD8522743.1 site-specific integrase [Lysinibacillus fusiformis]